MSLDSAFNREGQREGEQGYQKEVQLVERLSEGARWPPGGQSCDHGVGANALLCFFLNNDE